MQQFVYNREMSWQANFTVWREMNRKEREQFKEKELEPCEAEALFDRMYPRKKYEWRLVKHGKTQEDTNQVS